MKIDLYAIFVSTKEFHRIMIAKNLYLFLVMLCCYMATGQDVEVDKEIQTMERLIQFNKFTETQKKLETLYTRLDRFPDSENKTASFLKLKFTEALLLDRQDLTPSRPLKLLLEIKNNPQVYNMPELLYRTYLLIALCYEKSNNLELTAKYLAKANSFYKEHRLEHLYSTYCIRIGSYFRYVNQIDSTLHYAKLAEKYATKYKNDTDISDSKILLSIVSKRKKNYADALQHSFELLKYRKKFSDTTSLLASYNNIAGNFLNSGDVDNALKYNDSSRIYLSSKSNPNFDYVYHEMRYQIFESLKNTDSAYYHFKKFHFSKKLFENAKQKVETKKIEELYQNKAKDATIQNKTRQLFFSILLIIIISTATVLIIRRNKKINAQNKIINKQLDELSKTLRQKQMLLSELQHRVKNNLQHVISILEIQKESVNFNNIDELIRGYQNRIHSIALVHKKLNVTDAVNEVALDHYIKELGLLVKESYDEPKKTVTMNISCELTTLSIEKTLPLGLIVVELVSNSMKHAFKNRNIGVITMEVSNSSGLNKFYYADNGTGFDFNQTSEKGLGQEIIKGLIDQLDAKVETQFKNGFELTMYFK